MKRLIAVLLVLALSGVAWAGSLDKIAPEGAFRINFDAMTAVGNSTGYPNSAWEKRKFTAKTNFIDVAIVRTGTLTVDVWLQDSQDGTTFANAIDPAMSTTPSDTDSLRYKGTIPGGPYWRLHITDSDIGVLNTVTGTLELWR